MEEMLRTLFYSWWQIIKKRPYTTGIMIVLVVILFFFFAYWFGWDWTGLNNGTNQIIITSTSKTNYSTTVPQPSKSLWDWLQLLGVLAIPVVVGFGVAWYTARQNHDREITREQHANDLKVAEDNQREAALQAYIDKMSELLVDNKLRETQPEDEVRTIARVRTLTLLPKLNSFRKRTVIRFLQESGLLNKGKPIIDLSSANLVYADLHGARLCQVDMHEVDFRDANLRNAHLSGSDFRNANLCRAKLDGVELGGIDLDGANLKDVTGITNEELEKQATSLKGATMPDGSTHP